MKIRKAVGAGVLSLGLVVGLSGFASAATSADFNRTGPDSRNHVRSDVRNETEVRNDNNIRFNNNNRQDARTGDAETRRNTSAGGASTGSAENVNALDVAAYVDNSSSAAALGGGAGSGSGGGHEVSFDTTGPDSVNRVDIRERNTVEVRNNNNISLNNNNYQHAHSGDATVERNTEGGDATTGDARNENSSYVTIEVSN